MNNETKSRFGIGRKIASMFLSAALLATTFTGLGSVLVASSNIEVSAAGSANLPDNIQDGNILHCFNWKLSDIKEALPGIAEAGFTSVQTSPLQGHNNTGTWFWLYQPTNFSVGNELGSYQDLKDLCAEADKYGIKVIVDVVANHLAGWNDGRRADTIDSNLNRDDFFHNQGAASNWNDRNEIIYKNIGMPDLASENEALQGIIFGMINSMKEAGVDGIRWDAAKHIGLPSEGCSFWKNVAALGMYNYGEILDGPAGGDTRSDYNGNLMKEYGSYIGVTDANYSGEITGSIRDGKTTGSTGFWSSKGVPAKRLVYWAESHDTYSNDPPPAEGGWTKYLSEDIMDRAYAVVAARADSQALYLSRPFEKAKTSISYGVKGSTHYTEKQVAEVNKFKNAMVGQKEYLTTGDNCFVVCRGGGAVIVNASGGSKDVTVPNGGGTVPAGTYTDKISGSTFTVTSSTISGHIGDTGIAVFYNGGVDPTPSGSVSVSPTSKSFTDSTMTVTLTASNISDATYTTSEGDSGSVGTSKTITIGSKTAVGGTITVTVTGTKKDGTKATATGTYTKQDKDAVVSVYFDNASYNWSEVYAYVYKGDGASAVSMSKWPGTKMTKDSDTGYYKLEVAGFENGKAIFSDGTNSDANRYPADQKPGMDIGGSSMLFGANHSWTAYVKPTPVPPPVTKPTVTPDKASGSSFTGETMSLKLTLANATQCTYTVDGGPEKSFTGSSATITIGEGKIGDSKITVVAKAIGDTTETYTFTYEKKYTKKTTSSSAGTLSSYYSTNAAGKGAKKTITVDGDISDWDSSMIIAQGTANDDPRVYRPNSMFELPLDLYTLYGAYDDNNIYLMWEMTNVQDIVAPGDDYPLTQGILYQTMNIPFFIAISTGKSDTIGNSGKTAAGGTLWNSGITFSNPEGINRLIAVSTNGANGPLVYVGDSSGLNSVEVFAPTASTVSGAQKTGIQFNYGLGILSSKVYGLDGAYGATSSTNKRTIGDMCNENGMWVDFNAKGHKTSTMDFHYEMSIPLSELGISASDITSSGVGVMVIMTSGKSGMDCLPYDLSMNDQADLDDSAGSLENNSFEKSDDDNITVNFARIGAGDTPVPPPVPIDDDMPLQVNFGADKSAPQLTTTALTLKGIGYGGTAPYKYEFYVDGNKVQASSSNDSYTWKPGTADTHIIKCIITDSKGKTAESSKNFTAEGEDTPVPPPIPVDELTNSSKISATSITLGKSVTLTGAASGGTSPYQYAFFAKKSSTTSYTTVQGYSSTTTATFTPSAATTYDVRIKVKDSDGTVKTKDFTLKVNPAATTALSNTSKISATTVALGNSITVSCSATGGTSPYQYAVLYKKTSSTSYTTLQSYSTTKSVTLKPAAATVYDIRIKVKDAKGTVKTSDFNLTVTNVTTALKNVSTVSATSVATGSSVTITGKASGGTSPYYYAAYYKLSTESSFTKIRDFSTTATMTFKPTTAGTYTIRVKVKDKKGNIVNKDLTVKAVKALTNSSTLSATSVTLGKSVTITGKATGGTSPYKYAAYYKKSSSTEYTKIRDFSTTATMTFKPAAVTTYNVRVKVKDAKGTVKNKDFTVKVTAAALSNTSTISATSIKKGTTLTITGKATGGTSPYKYAAYYKKASSTEYTQISGYSTTAKMTVKPASATTYNIRVKVKDAKGTVANKDFTVKVTA